MATKRSEEFQTEVINLAEALESDTSTPLERQRIAAILRLNTTDNKCMVNALRGEPIFVIRGKDRIGADTVGAWAVNATHFHEPEKIKDALEVAQMMNEWRQQWVVRENERRRKCQHSRFAEVRDNHCTNCGARKDPNIGIFVVSYVE